MKPWAMWLIASVCFIGFTAAVKQQAELVIKSVDKNHQNINTHRFSLCDVVEKPVRIKIHQRSSRLQLKHDAAGDLSIAFSSDVHRTLEYKLAPDQWREINTTSEFSLHDHVWFSLSVHLPSAMTCGACLHNSFTESGSGGRLPTFCKPCPQEEQTVRKWCDEYSTLNPDLCQAADDTRYVNQLHFLQCPPVDGDDALWRQCTSSASVTFRIETNNKMPMRADECKRYQNCPSGQYHDTRVPGSGCIACTDTGMYGMHGLFKSSTCDVIDGCGFLREKTCVCAKGHYFDQISEVCLPCAPQKYQDENHKLELECKSCSKCSAKYAYAQTSCMYCSDETYWSQTLHQCVACPRTFETLQYNPDFRHDAQRWHAKIVPGAEAPFFINISACARAKDAEVCTTPMSILANRSECQIGQHAVHIPDDKDTQCKRCPAGTYQPTSSFARECAPKAWCAGNFFSTKDDYENVTARTSCKNDTVTIRKLEQNWSYPIVLNSSITITLAPGGFAVSNFSSGVRGNPPSIYVSKYNKTIFKWPRNFPITIFKGVREWNAPVQAEPDRKHLQTELDMNQLEAASSPELFYGCVDKQDFGLGAIKVIDDASAIHMHPMPLFGKDRRDFSFVSVMTRECDIGGQDPNSSMHENAVFRQWHAGMFQLPMVGVAACRFTCRDGFEMKNGECAACAPGFASNAETRHRCRPCPPGMYASAPNSVTCTSCETGKFSASPGAEVCTAMCHTNEICAYCNASTHYLEDPNTAARDASNCRRCDDQALEISEWKEYGMVHCFASVESAHCLLPDNAMRHIDNITCEPECLIGFRARYDYTESEWQCESCAQTDSQQCPPGFKTVRSCGECEACTETLMPFQRLGRECAVTCHAGGIMQKSGRLLYFEASNNVESTMFDSAQTTYGPTQGCVATERASKECASTERLRYRCIDMPPFDDTMIALLYPGDVNATRKILLFKCEDYDLSSDGNTMTISDSDQVRANCFDYFDFQGGRRRLLEDRKHDCGGDMYWDVVTKQCQPCGDNKMQRPGATDEDCICQPGFFNGVGDRCEECKAGESYYCINGNQIQCEFQARVQINRAFQQSDCIMNDGFFINASEQRQACAIDENGHQTLTKFTGRPVFDKNPCPFVCETEKYARRDHSSENPKCVCDETLQRVWSDASQSCVCKDGVYQEADGSCIVCPSNFFCSKNAKTACPGSQISPVRSRTHSDCRCDAGNYKSGADKAQCTRCPKRHYCPDGKEKVGCATADPVKNFGCPETGMAVGQVCEPGKTFFFLEDETAILDRDSAPNTLLGCFNGLVKVNDNDDVSRDENIRLYVNAVSYHVKDDKYMIQIVDVDSIPLIDTGQMDAEIQETFDDLSSTLRFDNVQKYGLMAATFQFFCSHSPVIIAQSSPNASGLNALRCWNASDDSRVFTSTADLHPLALSLGHEGRLNPDGVMEARPLYVNIYKYVDAHLAYATYLHCGRFDPGSTDDLQMSELRACPWGESGTHLALAKVLTKADSDKLVFLDAPSQHVLVRQLQDTAVEQGTQMLLAHDDDQFTAFVCPPHLETCSPVVLSDFFSEDGDASVKIVQALPTWRFWPDPTVGVLVMACVDSRVTISRHTLQRKADVDGALKTVTSNYVDYDQDNGRSCKTDKFITWSLSAQFLTILVQRSDQDFRIVHIKLKHDTERTFAQEVVLPIESDGVSAWTPRDFTSTISFANCRLTSITEAHFYNNCVHFSDATDDPICAPRLFILGTDVKSPDTDDTISLVFKKTEGGNLERKIVVEWGILYHILHSNFQIQLESILPGGWNTGKIANFVLASRNNVYHGNGDQNRKTSERFNVDYLPHDLDMILAVQANDDESRGLFVRVRLDPVSTDRRHPLDVDILAPFSFSGQLKTMRFVEVPLRTDTTFPNLISVRGRLVVSTYAETENVLIFELKNRTCGLSVDDGTFDRELNRCKCDAGHLPVAVGCKGHECMRKGANFGVHVLKLDKNLSFVAQGGAAEYIQMCRICAGPLFCPDGTKDTVQLCPPDRNAYPPRSTSIGDCQCDHGLQGAVASMQQVDTRCVPCAANQICNAFTNHQAKAMRCSENAFLQVNYAASAARQANVYECTCNTGFFSTYESATVVSNKMANYIFSTDDWEPSLLSRAANTTLYQWPTAYHMIVRSCQACTRDFYCPGGNVRIRCPPGSTSPLQSSNLSQCQCPVGSFLDLEAGKCVTCAASSDFICLHNAMIFCNQSLPEATHDLCPCKETGLYRVPGQGCKACPENHYCKRLSADLVSNNVPVPCPQHSKAEKKSFHVLNCTCSPHLLQRFEGVQQDNFTCVPCPDGHRCNGTSVFECKGMRCPNSGCTRDDEAAVGCRMPGMALKSLAVAKWNQAVHPTALTDHPLSPEYSTAIKQYNAYLGTLSPDTHCALCPPGFCCADATVNECRHAKHDKAMALPMGAFDDNKMLFSCPTRTQGQERRVTLRVGASACFDTAMRFAWGHKSQNVKRVLNTYPLGLVFFQNDPLELDDMLWKKLAGANPLPYERRLYAQPSESVFKYTTKSRDGVAVLEIDAARLLRKAHERLHNRMKQMLIEIQQYDDDTGLASELFLPCVWALIVNQEFLHSSDEASGRRLGEGIVVVNTVVRTLSTLSVAQKIVSKIFLQWNACQKRSDHAIRPPRVVFLAHWSDFPFLRQMTTVQRLLLRRKTCAHTTVASESCSEPYDGIMVSEIASSKFSVPLSPTIVQDSMQELELHTLLDFGGSFAAAAVTQKCPKGTMPSQDHGCSVCHVKDYVSEYYDFVSGTCQPCSVVTEEDCLLLGRSTQVPCSYTKDAGCR